VIHTSKDDGVNAWSAGLTWQTLSLEDASQDGLVAEHFIMKLLEVMKNQEKLMQSELESWMELQLLGQCNIPKLRDLSFH
jgi:hypothetical protein